MGRYWLKISYERNGCYRTREIFVKRGVEDLFEAFKSLMLDKYYQNKLRTAFGRESNMLLSMEVLYSASDKVYDRTPITCRRYHIVTHYDNMEDLAFQEYEHMSKKLKNIMEYLYSDMTSSYRKRQLKKRLEDKYKNYNKLVDTEPYLWTKYATEDEKNALKPLPERVDKIMPDRVDLLPSPFEEDYKSKPTSPLGECNEQCCMSPVCEGEGEKNLSPVLVSGLGCSSDAAVSEPCSSDTGLAEDDVQSSSMETSSHYQLSNECSSMKRDMKKDDPEVNIFFQ